MKVSSLVKDLAKDQRLESLLELVHHGLSKVERRTECRGMKCRKSAEKEEGLDLCLEDILVKGLGFGIDQ
jgi:hypothetical protein